MKSQLGLPQGDKLSESITELLFSQSPSRRTYIESVSALPVESLSLSKIISTLYSYTVFSQHLLNPQTCLRFTHDRTIYLSTI